MMTRLLFVASSALLSVFIAPTGSQAAFYLTGAQIYAAKSDGTVDQNNDSYRFTTNSADNGGKLGVTSNRGSNLAPALNNPNLDKSISFALEYGETLFEYTSQNPINYSLPGNYLGLNLFFTDTDQSSDNTGGSIDNTYNPSTVGFRAGDISAFASLSGNFDKVVLNGVVQNYMYVGYNYGSTPEENRPKATGSLSFVLGDFTVTLTDFTVNNSSGYPTGNFKLTVTATPEPSTIGIGALACCGLAGWVRKRRGKKKLAAG